MVIDFKIRSAASVPKESCAIIVKVEMNTVELRDRRRNASEVDVAIQPINNENTPKHGLESFMYTNISTERKLSINMNPPTCFGDKSSSSWRSNYKGIHNTITSISHPQCYNIHTHTYIYIYKWGLR